MFFSFNRIKFNSKRILPLICYEVIYSGNIKANNQAPDLVVNISEDAWFGNSIGPYQHFAKAIYRSVEEGVFIACLLYTSDAADE